MTKRVHTDNLEAFGENLLAVSERNTINYELTTINQLTEEALDDLKFCINSFSLLESYCFNAKKFAQRYSDEIV